ncbi:hypothetical protein HDU91_007427, partial [Kappamyces sp. JEL0680]
VDTAKWPDRPYHRTRLYRDAIIGLAETLQCPVLDTWEGFLGSSDFAFNQSIMDLLFFDGLHLSSHGNALFFKLIKAKIIASWPELHPDQMPMIPNEWRNVNSNALPLGLIE